MRYSPKILLGLGENRYSNVTQVVVDIPNPRKKVATVN
jgi:hypothetical protein